MSRVNLRKSTTRSRAIGRKTLSLHKIDSLRFSSRIWFAFCTPFFDDVKNVNYNRLLNCSYQLVPSLLPITFDCYYPENFQTTLTNYVAERHNISGSLPNERTPCHNMKSAARETRCDENRTFYSNTSRCFCLFLFYFTAAQHYSRRLDLRRETETKLCILSGNVT